MSLKIIKANELIKNKTINCIVYGPPGIGKTTFCSTAPNPLIIDLEGGCISVMDTDTSIIQARTYDDIRQAIGMGISGGYQTICFDSLTRYCEILLQHIVSISDKTKPQIQHFGDLIAQIKDMVWALQGKNINTIFVCLEKEIEEDGVLLKRPALTGQLTQAVPAIMDCVGYMQILKDSSRVINLNPSPKWYAKHRSPKGFSITEPVEPNFTQIQNLIFNQGETHVE